MYIRTTVVCLSRHHMSSHRISFVVPTRGLGSVLYLTEPAYTAAFRQYTRRTATLQTFRRSLKPFSSPMVTAFPTTRMYHPPPHIHTQRCPKTCPMIALVKYPGGQDGKGCLFCQKKGVYCNYSVKQKPGPKCRKRVQDLGPAT